jgi:hypothetical protein
MNELSQMKPPFALTAEDRRSRLWKKLMAHWNENLEVFRIQNEGDKTEVQTAKLRGMIANTKANLLLDKDLPELN